MRLKASDCRSARRLVLRRGDLDAVGRSWLDVHLRLCAECREVARAFEMIEAGPGETAPLSQRRSQEIYDRLVPVVHEITWAVLILSRLRIK